MHNLTIHNRLHLQVVDASTSINSNFSSVVGGVTTYSNNVADTFEITVRPFLKTLPSAIQNVSGESPRCMSRPQPVDREPGAHAADPMAGQCSCAAFSS